MDYPGKVITKTQVTPTQTSASGNWTLDDQAAAIKNNNWPVALVPNPISKSLRFNSADSAYLNRTPAGSGTLGVWTFSFWVKRAALGVTQTVFFSGTTNQRGGIRFTSGDLINCQPFNSTGANASWTSTAVFRDPSAWYHVVIRAFSSATGNSFGGVELALYINGVQQTFTLSTSGTPTGGDRINDSQVKQIGQITPNGDGDYLSAYLAEFNFIDGQALTPSSFGMTNPQTGQWIPLKYSGTYGTNGFYLNFKDATSTTTLGYDYSGNANNWTTNNFSVTAGSGNDSLTDVPTPWFAYNTTGDVGGVIRGNYATFNALQLGSSTTLNNGNLDSAATASSFNTVIGTMFASSGKWYAEVTILDVSADYSTKRVGVGIIKDTGTEQSSYLGSSTSGYGYYANATRFNNATSASYGATYVTNDVIGIAMDLDAGTLVFYKNNTSQGTAYSGLSGAFSFAASHFGSGAKVAINFGQRPFAYTPPTGFRSLCTTNLPATAIGFGLTNQGDDYMNVVLYTGTGSPLSVTGVGFKPDWVWAKKRSATDDHVTSDALRGVQKDLTPNSTAAEATNTNGLQSFDTDGFSIGSGSGSGVWGGNSGATYVAWCWKASNAAGVSNTAGTITSTVSASTTAGFSVVTWTYNSSGGTIGHGLGVAPSMIIQKIRDTAGYNWDVYHVSVGATKRLSINTTAAEQTFTGPWNNTTPTSTVFSSGASWYPSGDKVVSYCFAAVPGYSAFGSYTGNGSSDGPFVYTGFRPRFVLVKSSTEVNNWWLYDSSRSPYNAMNELLRPDLSNAEATQGYPDFLSNGWKIRNTGQNSSGQTYIYMAFAESPFQFANAR